MPTVITVEQQSPTEVSSRSNSFTDDTESTSGTGVHVSSRLGSHEDSDFADETWEGVSYSDDIEPSESASRPRIPQQYRPSSRPPVTRRVPVRRHTTAERPQSRPPIQRVRRQPVPRPPSSVDTYDDYPGYGRGYPPPQPYGGRGPQPGYAPTYGAFPPSNGQVIPYGSPAYQYPQNPFSPAPVQGNNYFPATSGHGGPGYGGHEITPYAPQGAGYGYPGFGGPSPPPVGYYSYHGTPEPAVAPAAAVAAAAPVAVVPVIDLEAEKKKIEEKAAEDIKKAAAAREAEKLKLEADHKQAELMKQIEALKLDSDKLRAEVAAKAAAEQKAKDDAAHKAETEKRIKEEVAKAKLETEAKLKAAAEKAKEEAEAAKVKAAADAEAQKKHEAEIKTKAETDYKAKLEKEAKALAEAKPKDDKKKPIKFKDAVGRKFSFPFHLCQTWAGMEELIRQAFVHVEVIGPHVIEGHYDLVGPNSEIILPQVWNTVIEPDMAITMHMWPMPEAPKPNANIIDARPPGAGGPMGPGGRPGRERPGRPQMPGPPSGPPGRRNTMPPVPPGWPELPPGAGRGGGGGLPPGVILVDEPIRRKKPAERASGGLSLGGLFGSKPAKSSKKKK